MRQAFSLAVKLPVKMPAFHFGKLGFSNCIHLTSANADPRSEGSSNWVPINRIM